MMKRKYVAIALGVVLSVSIMGGCSKSGSNSDSTSNTDAQEVIYGEVSEIGEDSITIKVGTQKEMGEKPEEGGNTSEEQKKEESETSEEKTQKEEDTSKEAQEPPKGQEQPSMLELTGEEKEIAISDDTVITKQSMGALSGGNMGEAPDGAKEMASGEAPEKPEKTDDEEVRKANGSSDGEEVSEKPEGADDGNAPEMPSDSAEQEQEEISLTDIKEGDTVAITLQEDGNAAEIKVISMGGGNGGDMNSSSGVDSYDTVTEYTSDTEIDGENFTSTGTDENAILVSNGASVNLRNITVSRTSTDSQGGDNSSFYGVGAAALTTDGTSYISDSIIETDAAGGAGIFAYKDGVVYTADTKITTKQDTSGGIHVAGDASLYAWDMQVETNGMSAAAIRSDRGGGKMVVDGGTYTSNGVGSPAIYSTANIAVNNADLTANGSEAVCIEGQNSIYLYDSNLTGNMSDDEQNDCTWNVILYQSMSGDSEEGNSTFEMNGGTLTAGNGGMFYTTNTESTITLSDVDITNAKDSEFFLRCSGNNNQRGWGASGKNGADCLFTAIKQEMQGDIIWDSISNLDFYMTDSSTLKGAFLDDESYANDGGDGYCNLYIGEDCTWIVTEDSVISSLSCAGTIKDEEGNTVTIKGSDGNVYVKGDSSVTITVDSYEDTVDLSGASSVSSWTDYQMEKPAEL